MSGLEGFVLAELASFIGVVCGACALLVRQIQKSRCKLMKCFCFHCERDVPPAEIENGALEQNGSSQTPIR